MSTILIRPGSASFEQILEDLTNHVKTSSEGGWKDFSVSSAGNVVMELLSGLGTFLHHDVMTARRETILETARLRSSIVGMAQLMGYPVRRKSAPKIKLYVTVPNQVSVSRMEAIGKFRSLPIVPLSDQSLSSGGVVNEVYCALGVWQEHEFSLDAAGDFAKYLLRNPNIENDLVYVPYSGIEFPLLELKVNPKETIGQQQQVYSPVSLVEYAEQLDKNSCLVKTHMDGIILIFGDNVFGRRAFLSDMFKFTYLTTEGLLSTPSISELTGGFTCTIGTLQKVELLYSGSNEDSTEKIRLALTKYNAARRRMVTIDDHKSILMSYKGVISANAQRSDISESGGCCSVDMTCLLEGGARVDQGTNVELDFDDAITISLNDENVIYQSSELHPSSIVLPQTGFVSSLSTGTRVWVKITSKPGSDPEDVPQGINSNSFYYVIRIPNTRNIRFATDRARALLPAELGGSFIQLNPPVSGNPINCTIELSIHQDTAKTRDPLGTANVIYETEASVASSVKVSNTFFTPLQTGDAIYVSYSDNANPLKNIENGSYYYAIRLAIGESYRIRFALDNNRATLDDRITIDPPVNGSIASGTMTLNRRLLRETITIGTSNVRLYNPEDPTEPGYIDLGAESPVFSIVPSLSTAPRKVLVKTATGGTILPGGIQSGKTYWIFNPEGTKISFAATEADAESNIGISLADPGSTVVGRIYLDVFYLIDEGNPEIEETINISPNSLNVVYESAYSYSSSIDLTDDPYWENSNGVSLFTGMKVRLSSDGQTVPPNGLEIGGFYYIIPIPGTNRIRFANTYEKAVGTENVPVEYIPLTPPVSDTVKGYLLIDFFLDSAAFTLNSTNIYYDQIGNYLNSINPGNTRLTGIVGFPYGYPTGTKISFFSEANAAVLPGGLSLNTFYYMIRIPGSTNIRFATTRSNAMRGLSTFLTNTGTVTGTITVKVYGTPEEDALREYLEDFRVAGEQIFFVDPIPVILDIKLKVVIDYASNTQPVIEEIIRILGLYTNKLSSTFNVGSVVKELQDIEGVLRLYIERPQSDHQLAFNEYLTLPSEIRTEKHIKIYIGDSSFVSIDPEETSGGYI